ncbi:MAG: hypothetical protein J6X38_05480, partial [Abditibacteriota bacterium]|nr:hypothetical protein [Abditibacteriota bacterium]
MKRLSILLIILLAASANCAVIKENKGTYLVVGNDYRAVVNGEGVMTSLMAWGIECLTKDGGCMDKSWDELNKLPGGKVSVSGNTLLVKGEEYTTAYNFADGSVKINVSGAEENVRYTLNLKPDKLTRRPDGAWRAVTTCMDNFDRFAYFV